MSKFNLVPEVELFPFKQAMGIHFSKVCNDVKSQIGRWEGANDGKDVTTKLSGVKCSASYKLKSNEGYALQMPPNNPLAILIRFGCELSRQDDAMGLRKVSQDGKTVISGGISSPIPQCLNDWWEKETSKVVSPTKEEAVEAD